MFNTRLKEKEKTAKGMEKATTKAMAKEAMAKEEKEKARSSTWTGMSPSRGWRPKSHGTKSRAVAMDSTASGTCLDRLVRWWEK